VAKMFTDSIEGNVEILRELVAGIPPEGRRRAKGAAVAIEKVWDDLRRAHPKDPAVALGCAFAFFMICQRMIEQDEHDGGKEGAGLIQLLN